jgi:hypothetical protein
MTRYVPSVQLVLIKQLVGEWVRDGFLLGEGNGVVHLDKYAEDEWSIFLMEKEIGTIRGSDLPPDFELGLPLRNICILLSLDQISPGVFAKEPLKPVSIQDLSATRFLTTEEVDEELKQLETYRTALLEHRDLVEQSSSILARFSIQHLEMYIQKNKK